jgi:hypothetical protein
MPGDGCINRVLMLASIGTLKGHGLSSAAKCHIKSGASAPET